MIQLFFRLYLSYRFTVFSIMLTAVNEFCLKCHVKFMSTLLGQMKFIIKFETCVTKV